MSLPLMEPSLTVSVLRRWVQELDEGPFSTLGVGERIAYVNVDLVPTLAAAAAWTRRIPLMTTVIAAPTHDPVRLAKQLATVDFLSSGRLLVGLGSGGRDEDFKAVGADPRLKTQASLARQVAIMRKAWAGGHFPSDAHHGVCPPLSRPDGIPLLGGAMGEKALGVVASWADANIGWSRSADLAEMKTVFAQTVEAWGRAGRPRPRLITGFYFAVGDDARAQVAAHMRSYFDYMSPDIVDAMAKTVGFAGSAGELGTLLKRIADLGADEVILIPTSADPGQVGRTAEIIATAFPRRSP